MPAVFQCPALAAKCDCEARGDRVWGHGWARETSSLKGEELRPDWKEEMRGLEGSFGVCAGLPAPLGSGVAGWASCEQERPDTSRKSTTQGCEALQCQSPAWPQALPGVQRLSRIQPNPAWTWLGEVLGTKAPWASPDPIVNDSWGWTPAALGFSPSQTGTSLCSCG